MRKELVLLLRMLAKAFLFFYLPLLCLFVIPNFPYATDPSLNRTAQSGSEARQFYEKVYLPEETANEAKESVYIETEKRQSEWFGITQAVQDFVRTYGLSDKKILEVGSGTGSLQDLVENYTGLDISRTVASRYHKPFVAASATAMPFPENSFDAIWTIWVLEHVPEPERMLMEMRRVLKPGGLLYLRPAWNCPSWAAQGYEVRPYGDFGLGGKLVKATIPLRTYSSPAHIFPIRFIRLLHYRLMGALTRLRFHALAPNYDHYWVPDSDAAISLDSFEAYLWFRSRGDQCLTCGTDFEQAWALPAALVFRIHKSAASSANSEQEP